MNDKYEDIINLPHPVSKTHQPMSMMARAAQFAPFAALTGHNAAIAETARLTDAEHELDATEQSHLDRNMASLQQRIDEHPSVNVTHFVHDARKAGGAFVQTQGNVKAIDTVDQVLIFTDGRRIPLRNIMNIVCNF